MPTAVVIASRDMELLQNIQSLLLSPRFRVYYTEDVIGVEVGGALKNIFAIGTPLPNRQWNDCVLIFQIFVLIAHSAKLLSSYSTPPSCLSASKAPVSARASASVLTRWQRL